MTVWNFEVIHKKFNAETVSNNSNIIIVTTTIKITITSSMQ